MSKNIHMERILFNSVDEALDKLKELNVLSKSKKVKDLDKLLYKKRDKNGDVISVNCKVIGYKYKDNPKDCINEYYENLIILVNEEEININIDYFKDMQSKNFRFIN